mmetsp:Transcript_34691/g.92412  ORF Transcript_34691/g.92412 Transcript_34691/m.92412 type:complete len:460 (-) Transcript_34691:48-1427(-)
MGLLRGRLGRLIGQLVLLFGKEVRAHNHVVDEHVLGEADAAPIRHVDAVHHRRMLARGTARLAVPLAAHLVDRGEADLGDQLRHQDVHRPAHARTDVRRAARDHAEDRVRHECRLLTSHLLHALGDQARALRQPREHTLHVAAHLHRDDAKVVALVDPVHERLLLVVEDAAPVRPVLVVARRRLHRILAAEEEVVVDQALPLLIRHGGVEEEVAGKVALELSVHLCHHLGDGDALRLVTTRVEWEHLEVARHADARRDDLRVCRIAQLGLDLVRIHIRDVLGRLDVEAFVVALNDGVEEVLEVVIRLEVARVAADERTRVAKAGVDRTSERPLGLASRDRVLVLGPNLRRAVLSAERRVIGRALSLEQGSRVLITRKLRVHDEIKVLIGGIGLGGAFNNILAGWHATELGNDERFHIFRPCCQELLQERLENRIDLVTQVRKCLFAGGHGARGRHHQRT